MKSSLNKSFRKKFQQLPSSVQKQAVKAYKLWRKDPYHNSLLFKKVSQNLPIYSVRISLNYSFLYIKSRSN